MSGRHVLEVLRPRIRPESPIHAAINAYFADPDDYIANRNLGLLMLTDLRLVIPAEPHLAKALAFDPPVSDRLALMRALAMVFEYRAYYDGAARIYAEMARSDPDYLVNLADTLFQAGRFAESSKTYALFDAHSTAESHRIARWRGEPPVQLLFPSNVACVRFGELAQKPEFYILGRKLGLLPEVKALFLVDRGFVINRRLLDYWRQQHGDCMTMVEDPTAVAEAIRRYARARLYFDQLPLPDGRRVYRNLAFPEYRRAWQARGGAPLLRLTDEDRERGAERLRGLGVPEGAWFAALHVRSQGSYDENLPWDSNRHRNARIADYAPAIRAVAERGGWVVRLGDPRMPPLPDLPNVVDYAHAGPEVRADWMDLYLCAACRFLIGTGSGPWAVASTFGAPVALTNFFPLGYWPYGERDLVTAKRYVRRDGRTMSIAECIQPPIPGTQYPGFFEEAGIAIVDNTPEEIAAVAVEMMDRLDGTHRPNADDERRQAAFRAMSSIDGIAMNCRIGAAFLRAHPELIGER